jgi:DNA-binding transcriptional MerR regulator
MNPREPLLTIQQLSSELKIPKPTLRFWEKELDGLITPHRTSGGQRRYTSEHVSIIRKVKIFREKGVPLSDIKQRFQSLNPLITEGEREIEILANRLSQVVRDEIYKFYNLELDGS